MKVKITVIRKTTYTSIVEMPEAEFKQISNALRRGSMKEWAETCHKCNELIDVRDWKKDAIHKVDEFREFLED